ncbi:uncharacterized protein KGF55_003456 [Candida pseudojiufengensis]|uniref:uncharacterized protein n=1 Tax=Candida pseudojiufengensis TaxID=497109 RepID=UPI002225900F|nr:uncharacterized protein KGF55_003456 [Candida pseudojiufengensis]KAI5962380.1 hypothetical protein KGF55_003456 [Candida pseudojiufengensis]
MHLFLKLPKEILSLIFSHIKDESILESLRFIPGLQYIYLEQRYSTFEINSNNKSMEALIGLLHEYNFTPSIIIGNINQIKQLIDKPTFRLANYEVKILPTTRFSDFVSILDKVYVIGIHLNQYLEPFVGLFKKNEIKSFLDYIANNNIQFLTTSHSNTFKIQFPISLKQITLDGGQNFELDLSELQYLESFNCKNLLKMNSLESLQLPTSIKNLTLYSCDFQSYGDLTKYNKLRFLDISYCPDIYGLIHSPVQYPDSLKIFNFISNFHPDRMEELIEEDKLDFRYVVDANWRIRLYHFPPLLKNLKIYDTMQTLDIRNLELYYKTLDCLELDGIGKLDLSSLAFSLQNEMSEIIITNCSIINWDCVIDFPESKQIKFTSNTIYSELFDSNLDQLELLKVLEMSDNTYFYEDCNYPLDPLEILSDLKVIRFKTPKLQSLILKSPMPPKDHDYQYSSKVAFEVRNLKKLEMINLNICLLNFDEFPHSLEELIIRNLKLQTINGCLSNLYKLKILDLQNNQINFSMLAPQIFPSSLNNINLSDNKIEDLNCLKLDHCVNLQNLTLKKVTSKDEPKGGLKLRDFCIDTGVKDAILTNYNSDVIFDIVNGVEEDSILKAKSKRRKIC